MQKTQVLKLNTSKDDVEAFFNKMKHKLTEQQSKGDNGQNYDITMILKHQNKSTVKQNVRDSMNQKSLTVKSILTQNDQNAKDASHPKKNKPKIYDQDMQLESRILQTEISIKQQTSAGKVNKSYDKQKSQSKFRGSFKMPSIASLFHFQKKAEGNEPSQNSKTKKSNFTIANMDKNIKVQEEYDEDEGTSEEQVSSESSQDQQQNEEQLKKHISRKHIDIFPNIEINSAVSQKLMSMKSIGFVQGKSQTHKRRCSIANEDLLSPRVKNSLAEQIKQQSNKQIFGMLGKKLRQKSQKLLISQKDCINQVKDIEEENEQISSGRQNHKIVEVQQLNETQSDNNQKSLAIKRPFNRKQTKQRSSAMVKKSIFESQSQQSKMNGTQLSPNHSKSHNHLQIDVHPLEMNPTEQSSSEEQDGKSSNSSNEQPEDSIYVIENKLNDCVQLLEKNQLSTLEDFLYEFKDKYFYVSNTRIQIKWRLLMAHCKENKKEFQRAAINYNNVIEQAKQNPKSLIIQPAEVYHRLGVCYSQIGWWNKGILAFTEALNRYKRCKNAVKYSQTMNNLGTLYLQAQSISLAEKCFIQSYNLKKGLYGKHSTKLLTSLFNIFQCNLLTKNYDQAQKVISVIDEEIISQIPQIEPNKFLYFGGLFRRKGKMEFLRGSIQQAESHYLTAFQKLSNKYPYCMEFGELMSCLGLLKLEQKKFRQAKQYYDKAIMLMNFYCSKDSKTILTLKKNLQYSVKMIKEQKQGWSSKRSVN